MDLSGTWQLDVPACPSLNGTIYIGREGDITAARYVCNDNTPSDAFYLWGRSIRIDSAKGEDKVVFRGSLDGHAGSGRCTARVGLRSRSGSPRKVSDEVPASFTLAGHEEAPSIPVSGDNEHKRASQPEQCIRTQRGRPIRHVPPRARFSGDNGRRRWETRGRGMSTSIPPMDPC